MLEVSTVGIPLSTTGDRGLPRKLNADYRLHMVDIGSCNDFADFLTQLMEAEKLSRKDLESLLKVSKAMVDKYINKDSKPGDDKLRLICERYPVYEFRQFKALLSGVKEAEPPLHTVRTEFGAQVGRIAESIQDQTLRFALLQLISSLERDARKGTGTK